MSALAQISRVKHAFRKEVLTTIINSLDFSILYCCSTVWANTTQTNIKKLQGIQNFAAIIVCNIRKYDHVSPALKNLKWIPVKSQLYLRDAVMAFKCMNGLAPEYLTNKFIPSGSVSGILGDPGAVSWDDTMFVVKVYCKIETVPEAFGLPASDWPEKFFSGQSAKRNSWVTLVFPYTT